MKTLFRIRLRLGSCKTSRSGIIYDDNVQGYTTRAVHVTYALGYARRWKKMQDNLYEAVSRVRARANAFSQRQTRENVVANVMNRGFNASFPIGDGVAINVLYCPSAHQRRHVCQQADYRRRLERSIA